MTSAVLYSLAVEVDVLWFLVFVAWVPWFWMLEHLDSRAAFGYATIAGTAATHFSHLWMIEPLIGYVFPVFDIGGGPAYGESSLPWSNLALGVFSLWQGLAWGIAGGVLAWLRRVTSIRLWWIAPICVAVVEAWFPDLFPIALAVPLAEHHRWIQLGEIGGLAATTFALIAINAGFFEISRDVRNRRLPERRILLFTAAWLVGMPAYGMARTAMLEREIASVQSVRFGVVQGNFGLETARTHRQAILREHRRASAGLEKDGAQVVVWGEYAYGYPGFYRDSTRDLGSGNRRVRRGFSVPLVFGLRVREFEADPSSPPWSSAWVLHSDGSLGDRYDKVHPLPLVEEVEAWVDGSMPNPYRLQAGTAPAVLGVDGHRLGVLLGHEDLVPEAARDVALLGVHVFVSMTSDSWFAASRAHEEHLRLAALRTVEHRRGLVRAANTGISAFVDPLGRVVTTTSSTRPDGSDYEHADRFVVDVPMMDPDTRTLYTRFGDAFVIVLLLFLAGAVAAETRTGRRST